MFLKPLHTLPYRYLQTSRYLYTSPLFPQNTPSFVNLNYFHQKQSLISPLVSQWSFPKFSTSVHENERTEVTDVETSGHMTKKQRYQAERAEQKNKRKQKILLNRKRRSVFPKVGPFKKDINKEFRFFISIGATHKAANILVKGHKSGVKLPQSMWIVLFSKFAQEGAVEAIRQLLPFYDFYFTRTRAIWNILLHGTFNRPLTRNRIYAYDYKPRDPSEVVEEEEEEEEEEDEENISEMDLIRIEKEKVKKQKLAKEMAKGDIEARQVIKDMRLAGVEPLSESYNIILTALSKNLNSGMEEIDDIWLSMKSKDVERKKNLQEMLNKKYSGQLSEQELVEVKQKIKQFRLQYVDTVSWNIYLTSLWKRDMVDKFSDTVKQMEEEGYTPDGATVSVLVSAYISQDGNSKRALEVIKQFASRNPPIYCEPAGWMNIVKQYLRNGELDECRSFLRDNLILSKNHKEVNRKLWLYDSLIFALLSQNRIDEANDIWANELKGHEKKKRLIGHEMYLEYYLRVEEWAKANEEMDKMRQKNLPVRAHFLRELYLGWKDRPQKFNHKFDKLY